MLDSHVMNAAQFDEAIATRDDEDAPVLPDNSERRPSLLPSIAELEFAVAFTRVMSVLMKSPAYRRMPLEQVHGLVLPAMLSGQFAIMDAEVNGQPVPMAAAFWAFVSPEIDKRFSDQSVIAPKLSPHEWRSGDIPWLVDVVGHQAVGRRLVERLKKNIFSGRDVKMRQAEGRRAHAVHPNVEALREVAA